MLTTKDYMLVVPELVDTARAMQYVTVTNCPRLAGMGASGPVRPIAVNRSFERNSSHRRGRLVQRWGLGLRLVTPGNCGGTSTGFGIAVRRASDASGRSDGLHAGVRRPPNIHPGHLNTDKPHYVRYAIALLPDGSCPPALPVSDDNLFETLTP